MNYNFVCPLQMRLIRSEVQMEVLKQHGIQYIEMRG